MVALFFQLIRILVWQRDHVNGTAVIGSLPPRGEVVNGTAPKEGIEVGPGKPKRERSAVKEAYVFLDGDSILLNHRIFITPYLAEV